LQAQRLRAKRQRQAPRQIAFCRQFAETSKREKTEEFKFSIPDPWSRQLFTALCRRYGLKPFR